VGVCGTKCPCVGRCEAVCSCARGCVQLCERLCDPCVCVLGVWCAFRGVDRWDLAVLACLDTRKDLAESAIARPPSLLVDEKKEENKLVVYLSLDVVEIAKSSNSTRCFTSGWW